MLIKLSPLSALAIVAAAAGCGTKIIDNNKKVPVIACQDNCTGQQIQYQPDGCTYAVTTVADGLAASYRADKTPADSAPIHVHAAFPSDPSTGFAVTWQYTQTTEAPVAYLSQLFYGTSESAVTAATAATGDVKVQEGHTVDYSPVETGTIRIHEVHLCGLTAGTTYFYKVGNTGAFSQTYSITTAPTYGGTSTVKFGITGDSRGQTNIWDKAQVALKSKGVSFQMFTGDAVDLGGLQNSWNSFFEDASAGTPASDILATIPIMMTNGNHDALTVPYLAQFAMPQQTGGGEKVGGGLLDTNKAWYSMNYGNVHLIVLNDTTASADTIAGPEATWLRNDLAAVDHAKSKWIFVFHHQPEYSCDSTHGSATNLRSAWGPLFDQNQVDYVFTGHVHNYQRTKAIKNGVEDSTGTVYVVAAGVGAPLYGVGAAGAGDCGLFVKTQQVENYVTVQIDGNSADIKAYDLNTGNVIDQMQKTK